MRYGSQTERDEAMRAANGGTALQFAQPVDPAVQMSKLERALIHAMEMERRAGTRVRRAATLLQKWQRTRKRLAKRIGEAEVQRIVNSDAAVREITSRKNTVRKTVDRLMGGTDETK